MKKKDNSTLSLKVSLRRNALREIENPIVLETHAGYGSIWSRCYADVPDGTAIEKDEKKAEFLAKQRPAWAVYEADCVMALQGGAGSHLPINFIDCDPYGDPWLVIDAFLKSDREFPDLLAIVVNDGLRQKVKMNGGWDVHSLQGMVSRYGATSMYAKYLAVCRELLQEKAGQRNYALTRWAGYYCGHADQMTHYAAIFQKAKTG